MITLLHGDNVQTSRNVLQQLREKAKGKEIRIIEGKIIDSQSFTQALQSNSLFGQDLVVIIEQLFSRTTRKVKLFDEFLSILKATEDNVDVILWEDKELSKTILSGLPSKTAIQLFKLPATIFAFLDAIYPDNEKNAVTLFANLIQNEAPELIFAMITKRIRQLLLLKTGALLAGTSPWQLNRLTSQAKHFTMEKLQDMYTKLPEIEFSIKSGSSPINLKTHINLWLLNL